MTTSTLYAIRDRMINYYLKPFVANSIQEVQAGIAAAINNPENNDALAQAPHHFEVWKLGTFNEKTGEIQDSREFLIDCGGLIRPRRESTQPVHAGAGTAAPGGADAPGSARGDPTADIGAIPHPVGRKAEPAPKAPKGRPGRNPGRTKK